MGNPNFPKVSERSKKFVPLLYMMACAFFVATFIVVNVVGETRTSGVLVVVGLLAIVGLVGGSILFRVGAIARGNDKAGLAALCLVLVSSSALGSSLISLMAAVLDL